MSDKREDEYLRPADEPTYTEPSYPDSTYAESAYSQPVYAEPGYSGSAGEQPLPPPLEGPGAESPIDDLDDAGTEVLVTDIEQTRGEMSGTIEAIGAKLDPQLLIAQAKDTATTVVDQATESVKEAATQAVDSAKQSVHDATIGRVENMVQNVSDTAQEKTGGVIDVVRQNPLPAAMAGVGLYLLWQAMSKNNSRNTYATGGPRYQARYAGYGARGGESGYGYAGGESDYDYRGGSGGRGLADTAGDVMGSAQQAAGSAMGSVQETAGNLVGGVQETAGNALDTAGTVVGAAQQVAGSALGTVSQTAGSAIGTVSQTAGSAIGTVQDTAGSLAQTVQQTASRAPGQIQRALQENPLGAGLVAVAVGATAALALPTTRREQEWYGKPRDAVVEKAQEQIETVMDRAQETAEQPV